MVRGKNYHLLEVRIWGKNSVTQKQFHNSTYHKPKMLLTVSTMYNVYNILCKTSSKKLPLCDAKIQSFCIFLKKNKITLELVSPVR